MGERCYSYRKLDVYQKAQDWVVLVYGLVKKFPPEERYALCDQVRRAAISVTSNIAEGMSRSSSKDAARFIEISYGSLMEVQSQLEIAIKLNYINNEELKKIDPLTDEIARMLSGLRASLVSRL